MATNKRFMLISLLASGVGLASSTAWSREIASPSACQAAASTPAISDAKAGLVANPGDLKANFALADAWSDAGCFNDAVQVLSNAETAHPGDKELDTRLRVARSLVGEEHYFDNLDRANADAKLKRESFRCTTLADLDACSDAVRLKPDDPDLLIAQGDALMRAKQPAQALSRYRLALTLAPNLRDVNAKINAAESQSPAAAIPAASNSATPSQAAPAGAAAAGSAKVASTARSPASTATAAAAAAVAKSQQLRVAAAGPAEPPVRRYSNAAPESRTH